MESESEELEKRSEIIDIPGRTGRIPIPDKDIVALVDARQLESVKWSARYDKDKVFQNRIDAYGQKRKALLARMEIEDLSEETIHEESRKLGSDLALGFGFVNEDSKDWTEAIKARCQAAGHQYGAPSIAANTWNNVPGIVRAAAFVGIQTAKVLAPDYAHQIATAQAALYLVYGVVQLGTIFYLPIWNGGAQSAAVARQAAAGPREIPDIKSDKRIAEDGTEIPLKRKAELGKSIAAHLMNEHAGLLLRHDRNELAIVKLYTQLVVMSKSGDTRLLRAGLNAAAALSGLASNIGAHDGLGSIWQVGWGVSTLGFLLAQPLAYARMYGDASGKDYLAKLATMFQIAALTGVGRLHDAKGKIDKKQLDKFLRGPIKLRLDNFKALLEYDRKVYQTALVAIALEGTDKPGLETYANLQAKLKDCGTATARKKVIDALCKTEGLKAKANAIGALYDSNEAQIKALDDCDLKALLRGDSKTTVLPPASADMLFGALKFAAEISDAEVNRKYDEKLCKKKGYTEKYVDFASIHQAAQKLGQSLELVIAGSAGPNLVKACFNLIQGVMLFVSTEDFRETIDWLGITQGTVQIAGSMAAMCLGYAYHEHIAEKNVFRDRNRSKPSLPNSGVLHRWYPNVGRMKGQLNDFTTLAAQPIPPEHLPTHPLHYEPDTRFFREILAQMLTAKASKFFKYHLDKGGKLVFDDQDDVFGSEENKAKAVNQAAKTIMFNVASSDSSSENPDGASSEQSSTGADKLQMLKPYMGSARQ